MWIISNKSQVERPQFHRRHENRIEIDRCGGGGGGESGERRGADAAQFDRQPLGVRMQGRRSRRRRSGRIAVGDAGRDGTVVAAMVQRHQSAAGRQVAVAVAVARLRQRSQMQQVLRM